MERELLDKILFKGESDKLELKSRFNDETIETIVAFSNSTGGQILIGVDDEKNIKGLTIGKESIQKLLNEIKSKTAPSIIPDIEAIEVEAKQVLVITVNEFPLKPVSFKGRYFKRIGNANHQLTVNEVVQMHLQTFGSSWDYLIDSSHGIDDLSFDKINSFINMANRLKLTPITESPIEVLKKLELIRNAGITKACFLLFNKSGSILSTVELGRFSDEITINDGLTIKEDLFNQAERIMEFIRKHLKVSYFFEGHLQRAEHPDYPPEALREIVLNMIVHNQDF
jgi:ATP-dependent DNA helicase RecG